MTHPIEYDGVIKHAKIKYDSMKSFYNFIKSQRYIKERRVEIYRGMCRSAFLIPPEVRSHVPGMNRHLEKMLNEGYLYLQEGELNPEDPVTKSAYRAYSKIATILKKS